jgi:CRP-like cAMP-binding protein
MIRALAERLRGMTPLSDGDAEALAGAAVRVDAIPSHRDLLREAEPLPRGLHVVIDGHLCRYRILEDGRRQILAFLLPGDLFDLRCSLLTGREHGIGTLTEAHVATVPFEALATLRGERPSLDEALRRAECATEAVYLEWIANLGQRSALERTAHLICELFHRARSAGLGFDLAIDFPMTQVDFADALGLSVVHVNRTLQELRRRKLITLRSRHLRIHDLPALEALGFFSPAYLQRVKGDLFQPERDAARAV